MIQESRIESALAYIRDNAPKLAEAKANRIYLEQYRKTKKAMLVQEAGRGTVQERESYAYAHEEYLDVLEGLKSAVSIEEEIKWRMVAAQALIEAWRTQNANLRRGNI